MFGRRLTDILRAPAVRFLAIMFGALLLGIAANWIWQDINGYRTFNDGFGLLFAIYAVIVLIAGCVVSILSRILSGFTHKGLVYISLAAAGLILSLIAFPPHEYGGFHIVMIAWFGLLLAAVERYFAARHSRLSEMPGYEQGQ
jgi:hypothetical protein